MGVTDRTVRNHLASLEKKGYIRKHRLGQGRVNWYWIPDWTSPTDHDPLSTSPPDRKVSSGLERKNASGQRKLASALDRQNIADYKETGKVESEEKDTTDKGAVDSTGNTGKTRLVTSHVGQADQTRPATTSTAATVPQVIEPLPASEPPPQEALELAGRVARKFRDSEGGNKLFVRQLFARASRAGVDRDAFLLALETASARIDSRGEGVNQWRAAAAALVNQVTPRSA